MSGHRSKSHERFAPTKVRSVGSGSNLDHPEYRDAIGVDPNPLRTAQVKREFELRSQGYSLGEIRKIIIKEGYLAGRKVSSYSKGSLEKRLKNPMYGGDFRWKGELYAGKHEVFIDLKVFEKVQESFGLRTVSKTSKGVFGGGFLECSECGCGILYDPKTKITTAGKKTVYPYYHCSNGKRFHRSMRGMNVHEKTIWKQFEEVVDQIKISEKLASRLLSEVNKTQRYSKMQAESRKSSIEAEITSMEANMSKAMDCFYAGVLDAADIAREKARIKSRITELQKELESLDEVTSNRRLETVESIIELALNAKTLFQSASDSKKLEIIDKLLSNLRVRGKTLEYDVRKPFADILKMSKIETGGPGRTRTSDLTLIRLSRVEKKRA